VTLATALRLLPGVIILALLFAVIGLKSNRDLWKGRTQHLTQLREFERKSYDRAQEIAADLNKAEIERIRKQQEAITDEVSSDLNARLERLRRELSKPGTPAAPGAPKGPGTGGPGQAPGGADGSAGVCLAPEELLRGAENEERHERLIEWVRRQSEVRP
jgi:hypothetical protein